MYTENETNAAEADKWPTDGQTQTCSRYSKNTIDISLVNFQTFRHPTNINECLCSNASRILIKIQIITRSISPHRLVGSEDRERGHLSPELIEMIIDIT